MTVFSRANVRAPVTPVKKIPATVSMPQCDKNLIKNRTMDDAAEKRKLSSEFLGSPLFFPLALSGPHSLGSGQTDQDAKNQDQKNSDFNIENTADLDFGAQSVAPTADSVLPLHLNRLGALIAGFVVYSSTHSSWAVQIPISHELLQKTVLHMRCEQLILTLRFETSDWGSREDLALHTPALIRRLRKSLPQILQVSWISD